MQGQFPSFDVSVEEVSASELKRRLDSGEQSTLLDTRRPDDFEQWTLTHPNLDVVNVPFTEFLDEDGTRPVEGVPDEVPPRPLITCCAKGISSLFVAEFLASEGWEVEALEDGMEGWALLHECRRLQVDCEADVYQFHRPSSGCLSYLLVAGDEAAVIDPLRAFTADYEREARERGATLEYALDTHVHADHVSGIRAVAETTGATPAIPAGATERGLAFDATLLEDGETFSVGGVDIEAVSLPGHTSEMMGYRTGDVFATGDTLFLDGVARPDLEDEERARVAGGTLWETLQSVANLPDETVIAPGHVGPTTAPGSDGTFTASLGDLEQRLDAFGEQKDRFVDRILEDLPPRPNNFEQIIAVNLGRDSVTGEEAFELELGPNNCAVDG